MNRRDVLLAAALTAVLLLMLVPFARIGVDAHHDGIMLKPAFDVLAGQVLFRDSFMQYGALSTYLQALALAIQPTLWSVRMFTVACYAATLVVLFAAWRLILPRSLAVVAGLLFILFIPAYETDYWVHDYWKLAPWSSVYAMMFQALGLYALFRVIRGERSKPWALVLGMAAAGVFWCRQPVGGMMVVSLAGIWAGLRWAGWQPADGPARPVLVRIVGGLVLVNALFFGGMLPTGALPAWWYQNVVWPARWSEVIYLGDTLGFTVHPAACAGLVGLGLALALPNLVRRYRPDLGKRAVAGYFLFLGLVLAWQHQRLLRAVDLGDGGWRALFPLIAFAQAGISLWQAPAARGRPKTTEYYLVAALAGLTLGSLLQYYPMADSWHIFYSLAPGFGLFVYALWRWTGWSAGAVALGLTALFVPSIWARIEAAGPALNRPLVTLERPALLAGMRVPPEQARSLTRIADTVARVLRYQPDIPSAMIGDNALYLCLGNNRENPTPYFVTWRGLASQEENLRRWSYIGRVRPLLILQKARWKAVDEFYRGSHYVPLCFVPAEELEIAVPQELADRMGLGAYPDGPRRGPEMALVNP